MQLSGTTPTGRNGNTEHNAPVFPVGQMVLFTLVTVLFFLWGMSNNLTDILVQQFKKSFELSKFSAQLVSTANFTGYFCMAIPAALVMRRWGYKAGMVMGLTLFGAGMVLFWPAARTGEYGAFLLALFSVGCGASVLETACNPFMAQFGPAATSERRLNFAQAFNPPGTIVGVWVGRQFILSGREPSADQMGAMKLVNAYDDYIKQGGNLHSLMDKVQLNAGQLEQMRHATAWAWYSHWELMRVVPTYIVLGTTVLAFMLVLSRMHFPVITSEHEDDSGGLDSKSKGSFRALLHYPQLWAAVAANVCNVGGQICMWANIIFYVQQYSHLNEKQAADYILYSLVALLVGRFVSTPLMRYIQPSLMLGLYGLANVALMAVSVLRPGMLGAWAIVAASFFLSIMFPTIFALGLKGLGENTKLAGSFLVMAIVGGALFPLLLGRIADATGSMAMGYTVPLALFAGVAIYGFVAPKILSKPGMTDPDAGMLVAEYGEGI
jgi:MFS transporter, FHS family, L-fucose permease